MLKSLKGNDVAIQLVIQNSQYNFFLKFRDASRANPQLVEECNGIKLSCGEMSIDEYPVEKSKFITAVLNIK